MKERKIWRMAAVLCRNFISNMHYLWVSWICYILCSTHSESLCLPVSHVAPLIHYQRTSRSASNKIPECLKIVKFHALSINIQQINEERFTVYLVRRIVIRDILCLYYQYLSVLSLWLLSLLAVRLSVADLEKRMSIVFCIYLRKCNTITVSIVMYLSLIHQGVLYLPNTPEFMQNTASEALLFYI